MTDLTQVIVAMELLVNTAQLELHINQIKRMIATLKTKRAKANTAITAISAARSEGQIDTALAQAVLENNRAAEKQVQDELRHLIDLLKETQPIRRTTVWPAEVIIHIAERQQWRCAAPDCSYGELRLDTRTHHVDHIIPWALGGGNETANIQILHATCNLRKGARASIDDVIRYLQGRIRNI